MFKLDRMVGFAMTTKPEQALNYYRDVLGFKLVKDDGFALVFDAHGSMLRVGKGVKFTPAPYTILGWQVADIKKAAADLSKQGVAFARFPGMPQDELGIWTAPDGDSVAWFKDPDGNVLSISQHK
ncbi:MAG: VOC family protein [Candidatus Acidiferrales bacterium]